MSSNNIGLGIRWRWELMAFPVLALYYLVYSPVSFAQSSAPQKLVDRVLLKADKAYAAQRYTQPQHDNAFDRYTAVLMIEPRNVRALQGLKKVRNAYIDLAEQELAVGSHAHAQAFLALLKERYPKDDKVAKLGVKMRKYRRQAAPANVVDMTAKTFVLDRHQLAGRGAEITGLLKDIAARVATTHESVMISARSDSEGRWIYQIMNAATPTYRVRGDIKISRTPTIKLQSPF